MCECMCLCKGRSQKSHWVLPSYTSAGSNLWHLVNHPRSSACPELTLGSKASQPICLTTDREWQSRLRVMVSWAAPAIYGQVALPLPVRMWQIGQDTKQNSEQLLLGVWQHDDTVAEHPPLLLKRLLTPALHTYLEVRPTEINGINFWVDMHRAVSRSLDLSLCVSFQRGSEKSCSRHLF